MYVCVCVCVCVCMCVHRCAVFAELCNIDAGGQGRDSVAAWVAGNVNSAFFR